VKTEFVYTGIRVKDIEKSLDFYTRLLGMKVKRRARIKETGGEFILLQSDGGQKLELNYYPEGSKFYSKYVPGEELDHLAFRVENLEEAVSLMESEGYRVELEVRTEDNRWIYVKDPNGIWVELYQ
jgi:catechol 2,3-dioxygenase-like lactoylglutathione lyase family enzyme